MKTSKKIISIVLALVMLTSMVTSVFYASACNSNNHDPYKEAATVLDTLDNKLDAYNVDITGMLDGLLDSKELIATANGYISEDALNGYISKFASKYLESGQWLIDLGNEKVAELLDKYLRTGITDDLLKGLFVELFAKLNELPEIFELDAYFPTVAELDALLEKAIGDYLDGEKLIALLDKLVADAIEGKLIYEENGRRILKGIDPALAAKLDKLIEGLVAKYVNDGAGLIKMGDEKLMELLNTYEVQGVPIMQLRYLPALDALVDALVLSDNSSIMQTAANALSGMFPGVQPTYDSIISCLIPILSAFDFGAIMGGGDIAAALQLASPSGFAYLAGLQSPNLDQDYLDKINASLTANGYTGSPVTAFINLPADKAAQLLQYVQMEKEGASLSDIADAGFNWTDFTGGQSNLDIANAFVKIALGDANKLGDIASAPGVGQALVNLLCDLLNDLKTAPVSTLLKKLSDAEGLSAIADFAMGLLGGDDSSFKSYQLFFTDHIYYDKDGDTTFYDAVVDGNLEYTGPKAMQEYIPVIAAALDLLNGIYDTAQGNGGDLLKTLLVDKLPQLGNLLKSAISYTDEEGNPQLGMVAFLLDDYKSFLQATNTVLSNEVLIGLAELSIEKAEQELDEKNEGIAFLENKLAELKPAADAAKLAKAKELGLFPEETTTYSDEALEQAIQDKTAEAQQAVDASQQAVDDAQAEVDRLEPIVAELKAPFEEFDNWLFDFGLGSFYDDLKEVFESADYSDLLDNLRSNYKDEYNEKVADPNVPGDDPFEELIADIISEHDNFDPAFDDIDDFTNAFIENCILYGGRAGDKDLEYFTPYDNANQELEAAKTELTNAQNELEAKQKVLNALQDGTVANQVAAAGNTVTINIKYEPFDLNGNFTEKQIKELIETTKNEDIKNLQDAIAAQQASIASYQQESAEAQSFIDNYDMEGVQLEQKALNDLVDSLMVFLGGDENTKSLYKYFEDNQPIEMLLAPDRVKALKGVVDGLISLFGDKLDKEGTDYKTQLWKIEDILFGDKGILSTLYTDFKKDPVLSVATRLAPLGEVVDTVYEMGFLRDLIDQYKPLIDAVTGLFGDDSSGFISNWKKAYSDGTATHHYTNAVLSLLPKIVSIYDQVKDMDAVKELIEPYKDIIDYVLGLLSKDFYDDIINDGIVETLLEDNNLEKLQSIINGVLDKIDGGDKYKSIVNDVFDKVLDGLYQDLLVDPVLALSNRIGRIANLVDKITDAFGIDISDYKPLINDIKNIFDNSFAKDWKQSKITALVNKVPAITKLLNDALANKQVKSLLNNIPEEYKDIVDAVLPLVKNITSLLNSISKGLVKDYQKSPIRAIAKRGPQIIDLVSALTQSSELINFLFSNDDFKNIEITEGLKIGDIEGLIRRALADFNDFIAPALKQIINSDTVNTYDKDKTAGLVKIVNGLADIIAGIASDTKLVNGILNLAPIKNISITDDITLGDLSGLIKAVAAILPEIIDAIDIQDLIKNLQTQPTKTIFELKDIISYAIDQIVKSNDPLIQSYVKQFKNTIALAQEILDGLQLKGDRIIIKLIDTKKPIDSLLSSSNIKKIRAAAKEITSVIGDDNITALVDSVLDLLDGLVDDIKNQPLLTTVEQLGDSLARVVANARKVPALAKLIAPYNKVIDVALALIKNIGKDAEKSYVGAILTRIDKLQALVDALFDIDGFADIEIKGIKLGDLRSAIDLLFEFLGGNFYAELQENPLKAIMTRIETVKAIYEYLRDSGILATILKEFKVNPVILGYNILTAVDYLLPILDNQLYDDFEQSIFLAITARSRAGRIEEALKNIIWFADIFAYSVNDALCSAISGIFGLINGLYEDLVLPATPAKGGNQLHSTSRVIVSKFPKIQQLFTAIAPLFGTDRRLFNVTDVVSDTVKMEKDDILKMIAGVDLIKPYYYGISDVLDVVGENAAKYNWNNSQGIINALNGVGKALVPALEKALGVSDVKWKDLKKLDCEYDPNGTAESYLVEFSGEIGEGVLTSLVGTLLKAALTIPAIKDMVGDVAPEEIASLLNDLLEFDFKNNEVKFDDFNTEHLIYTAINLVLPKTAKAPSALSSAASKSAVAKAPSPGTSDEIVMIAIAVASTATASTAIYFALKKRRRELVDIEG